MIWLELIGAALFVGAATKVFYDAAREIRGARADIRKGKRR